MIFITMIVTLKLQKAFVDRVFPDEWNSRQIFHLLLKSLSHFLEVERLLRYRCFQDFFMYKGDSLGIGREERIELIEKLFEIL